MMDQHDHDNIWVVEQHNSISPNSFPWAFTEYTIFQQEDEECFWALKLCESYWPPAAAAILKREREREKWKRVKWKFNFHFT
jgi:hypothetical protein